MSASQLLGPHLASSLLVNFVYCHPVGHAIEALHYCHGYHLADPDLHIGVAMVSATPVELASLCPFVNEAFSVALDVFDATKPPLGLETIPTGWSWVVDDARAHQAWQRNAFPGIAAYYDRADNRFASSGSLVGTAGAAPPEYVLGGQFRLHFPDAARERAAEMMGRARPAGARPRIAVLPAGSGAPANYPSLRSWRLIVSSLREQWPSAQFCIVGKLHKNARTSTSFERKELEELLQFSGAVDAVDRDLVDQLALVAGCDVFISPHSGFGMAALAAGTPWLSISGGRWQEYYFNGVPFYSVLPDIARFPAFFALSDEPGQVDDDGPRAPSMCFQRVQEDLDEIVEGAALLIERRWPYETAMADHFKRMLKLRNGRPEGIWSVDGLHKLYIGG